jgi:hypothetical protein
MTMTTRPMLATLLVLSGNSPDCNFAIAATRTTPTRHQVTTAKRRFLDFDRVHRKEIRRHESSIQQTLESDRRVIPWVSIAILLNILFFFRSFAAPFFDPLVSCTISALVQYHNGISQFLSGRTPSSDCFLGLFFPACIPLRLVSSSYCFNSPPPGKALNHSCRILTVRVILILYYLSQSSAPLNRGSFPTTTTSSPRLLYSFIWYLRVFVLCC